MTPSTQPSPFRRPERLRKNRSGSRNRPFPDRLHPVSSRPRPGPQPHRPIQGRQRHSTVGTPVRPSFACFASFCKPSPAFLRALRVLRGEIISLPPRLRASARDSDFRPLPSTPVTAASLTTYNAFLEPVHSGLDLNANGVLDPATDRVSGQSSTIVQIGADTWSESTSWTYPNNDDISVPTGTSRSRLTGLGSPAPAPYTGLLTSESVSIDHLGNQTTHRTYTDALNQTTWSVTDTPDSTLDAVTKTIGGLTVESTSPVGQVTSYTYDDLRRPIGSTSTSGPRSLTSTTHYNPLGQVDYIEDSANHRTTFVYDELGRRAETTDPLNQSTHTAYDKLGRVIATWGATYPVAYDYDDQGRMIALYTYRGTNEVASAEDLLTLKPAMDKTTWVYDPATGLLTQKLDAANKGAAYTYTSAGQLATRTWARGITNTYAYDPLTGELTSVDYSDDTPDVVNTHDRLGRPLTSITQGVVTNTYAYSPTTLALTTETFEGVVGDAITHFTDALGRNAGFQTYGGMTNQYGYDSYGRFSSITNSMPGATVETNVVTYAYLPNSRLLTGHTLAPQGGSGVPPLMTRAVTYEPDRNLIASVTNTWNTTLISSFDYTNDALGRRTERADSGSAFSSTQNNAFGYNSRSEVQSAAMRNGQSEYAFDPIGNRLEATLPEEPNPIAYTANLLNQYTAITGRTQPAHDDDGNMTDDGAGLALAWDGENRLIQTVKNGQTITYAYDANSRRIAKTVGDTTHLYLYDGWNVIRETIQNSQSTIHHSYLWGLDLSQTLQGAGGVGGLLLVTGPDGTHVPTYDANGNISEYIALDTGTITAHLEYDAFGRVIASTGTPPAPFAFSTKYSDGETGLLNYGYRPYHPELGRWPNRDPIGERGGVNVHAFVQNGAITWFDLFGLVSQYSREEDWTWNKKVFWEWDWPRPSESAPFGTQKVHHPEA